MTKTTNTSMNTKQILSRITSKQVTRVELSEMVRDAVKYLRSLSITPTVASVRRSLADDGIGVKTSVRASKSSK